MQLKDFVRMSLMLLFLWLAPALGPGRRFLEMRPGHAKAASIQNINKEMRRSCMVPLRAGLHRIQLVREAHKRRFDLLCDGAIVFLGP